ncbi:hypothetical protein FSP39_016975 [Pinctada imbricata]|uniref:Uncharacterized protein n=1 Tax=Pinctada imbricata TaxID=66713 RepID=A0AA89C6S0_PINIB|nr:hypothetical protein FSP39_016975 [Pinctada imbricata]
MTNLKNSVSEDPKINDALRKASAMSTKIKKKNTEGSKQKAEKVTPKGVGSKKVSKVEKIKDDGKKYLVVDTPISEGEKDTQRNDCESVDMTHSNAETGSQNLRFKSMVLEIEQSLTNTDSSRPRSSESYKSDGDYEANRSVSPTSSAGSLKSFHSLDNFDEDGINFDDGSNNLFCLICGIRFKTVVSLRHHVRNACKSGRRSLSQLKDYEYLTFYRCSSCGRSSTSDVFLDEHVKRCTEKVNLSAKVVQCFKCEMCGLVSQDKAFIVTHVTKDCSRVKVAETQRNERFRMLEHVSSAVLSQGALKEQSSSDSKFEISHRTFSDESVLKCKLKSDKVIVAKKDFVKQSDENKKLSGDSKKCENEAFGFEDLEDVEDGKSAAVVKKDGDNVTRNLRNRQVTSSSQQMNDRVVQQEVSTRVLRNSPRGKVSPLTEDSKVPNKFTSRSDKPNSKETKTKHPTLSIKEDRESCIQTRSNKASNLQKDRTDSKSSVVQQKGTDDENDRSNKAVVDQKEVNCKTRSHSGISERVDTSKAPSGRKNTQSIDKMHTRSRSSSSDIGKTEQQSRSRNTSVGSSVETVESLTTPSSSTSERFELRSSKRLRHDSGSTEKSWKSEDSDASATKTKRSRLDKHILQKSSTSAEKVETESVRSLSTEKSESDLITE